MVIYPFFRENMKSWNNTNDILLSLFSRVTPNRVEKNRPTNSSDPLQKMHGYINFISLEKKKEE